MAIFYTEVLPLFCAIKIKINQLQEIMKTIFFIAALILCGTAAFSQVGINTSTPTATLDIRSTDQSAPSNTDGLLIPKVDAFPAVNPTAAQQGMMVYLTTASGAKAPGFYYWDNTTSAWIGIGGSAKGWDLNGNLGTTPATNFIGTTDAQPVVLKTDNAERMRIDSNGNVGIGTTSPLNKFHVFGGASGMTPNPFSVATLESTVSAYLSVLSAAETGIIFGSNGNSTNGAIVYNNPGLADGMLFRTNGNVNRMVIGPTGNIGFGNFVPSYPLQFPSAHGDKVALWGGAGVHYGLGIQAGLLQIHTDGAGSDVAFGYGTSAAMTETMRVKGNGRVGVGIGLPNARMEVAASSMVTPANTDGLIIPRMNAFPAVNPTAAQNGMLVFLATTVGAFQPGFYYWNNPTSSWKGIGSSGTPNDWGLAGNAGTTAANNFIGTTDDNDLVFKRNNIRSGVVGTANTAFGNNTLNAATTGTNNTAVGANTLTVNSTGYSNTAAGYQALKANNTGFRNTAIGTNALANNTTGGYSVAIGTDALISNTTGGSNTAVGDYTMISNIDGLFNVTLGNSTLKSNTDGDGNTALGHRAMFTNTNGNNSTGVGMNALYNNQASGSVGVGVSAGSGNTTGQFNTAVGSFALQNNTTGGFNTAVGYNAALGSTGDYNTALGVNALFSGNTASGITAIGHASLYYNTTGYRNTAVGNTALNLNTTGSHNTAMGASALHSNNGDYNSAFGVQALVSNTTGVDNSAFGAYSMALNTLGIRNTAQGGASLNRNTTGSYNSGIGYFALGNNDTGSGNTAMGAYTLLSNLSGSDNTAFGTEALKNTTASGGTAVGKMSLFSNVSGLYNTAVGMNSLRDNVSGSYNTATGYNALITNTGTYNTATGVNSLYTNSTGNSNTAVGYRSLYNNTTAGWNTAIGDAAMYENITGEANSALGHHALQGNKTGNWNTVMGVNALYHNPSGDNNTAIGHSAMANVNPGGNNTALGASAMVTQTAGDNNIAIGVNSALPSLTGSNQLSIGNVIYGSGMNAAANAKIGIGKATPDAKFEVAASNAAAPSNTDGMLIPRVNAFPITNPTAAQNGMMVYLNNAVGVYAAGFYYWDNTAVTWLAVGSKTNWNTFGTSGTNPSTHYVGTSDNNDVSLRANGTEAMRLEVGGNVGIGTTNPTTKLEVNGFTKLGSTAPAIKTLKLTGTTNASQGVQTAVLHGLTSSKILSVNVLVEYAAGASVPPNYGGSAGYEFDYFINATSITVWTKSGNSANILSKPFRILVTYEE